MSGGGSKTKKKHIKAVSQKVKIFRANEPLLSVFMWGINHTINELNHVTIPVMLMPDDFKAYTKTKVDNHLFNKDNMPSHFKFKEYCPIVFRNLRERFGIDDQDYMLSLTKSQPMDTASSGRSGARFLTSYDKRFVIKSLISEEVEQVHNILKMYHQYVVESHGKTLLPQFLGMYRLTVDGQVVYLMVMRNVFSYRFNVHKKFDLKGSTVARQASEKEREKELPTFKDNDFLTEGCKIIIGDDAKEKLLETINRDVELLSKLSLMDYSLLVGIHDIEKADQEEKDRAEQQEDGEGEDIDIDSDSQGSGAAVPTPPDSPLNPHLPSSISNNLSTVIDPKVDIYAYPNCEGAPRREIYFMAIIDILTHYGMKKRTAQAAKTVKHGAGAQISTVSPDQYAKRFLEFMTKILQ